MVRQSTAVTPEPILGLLVFHQVLQLLVSLVVVSKLVHSYSVLPSVYMRLRIFSILCIIFIQGRGGGIGLLYQDGYETRITIRYDSGRVVMVVVTWIVYCVVGWTALDPSRLVIEQRHNH